jgi:hypothetical protein
MIVIAQKRTPKNRKHASTPILRARQSHASNKRSSHAPGKHWKRPTAEIIRGAKAITALRMALQRIALVRGKGHSETPMVSIIREELKAC